jgi:DNA primase
MARIPDDELQRIKSQVAVEDLCRDYGIELTRMGPDNLMGRCPFHNDHTPSFGVTPSKNLWNCLAGCGGGDVIELVVRKQNVSFRQAVDVLRQRLGILPEDPTIETRTGTTHPMLVPASETELADHVLLGHVLDFYHQTFLDDLKAMRYLQARRCFDAEAVKVFKIGYADRTLCYRVPGTTAAGRRLKEQLQRLGVIRMSGHEHLSGSVIVPIFDEHGNVAQMYARKITRALRQGTPLHLYLPGEHRTAG